jgi:DNA helicase IV
MICNDTPRQGLEFDAVVVVTPTSLLGSAEESLNESKLVYVSLTRVERAVMLIQLG